MDLCFNLKWTYWDHNSCIIKYKVIIRFPKSVETYQFIRPKQANLTYAWVLINLHSRQLRNETSEDHFVINNDKQ